MRAYGEISYFSMGEFNNLLQEKAALDKKVDWLIAQINKTMEAFPAGIAIEDKTRLNDMLREEAYCLPETILAMIHGAEIDAIVCDAGDTILDISRHLMALLGYQPQELIGAYKGKLWVDRPDIQDTDQSGETDYIYSIYKVKQKHFPAVHEDAYINSRGNGNSGSSASIKCC